MMTSLVNNHSSLVLILDAVGFLACGLKAQVGEATVERADGELEAVEVLLRPYLDPEAGGLSWRPLEAEHGMRCITVRLVSGIISVFPDRPRGER
jgi:hypothetical protein